MRKLLPIVMLCGSFFACSKEDNSPKCPNKTCDHRATRLVNGVVIGEDCYNIAEPCKNYCKEHINEEQK